MPKPPAPWFRSGRGWFATVKGRQYPLDVPHPDDRDAAIAALRALLERLSGETGPPGQSASPAANRTVESAVGDFLGKRKAKVSAGAFEQYRYALSVHLVRTFGGRLVCTLAKDELEAWADRPAWSNSTRNNYLGAVGMFLRWTGHPLALTVPPKESRGAETVLSDEQFARVLARLRANGPQGDLCELLCVLRETGARPQEIATLTVEAVDWPNTCVVLKKHKTARHGIKRPIHFSAAAMKILEGQRAKYDTGILFRTLRGNAYQKDLIVRRLSTVSKRLGFRVIAYGNRHSFATKALVSGIPEAVVAALLGHTSTAMVSRNYGHVSEQSRVLKDAVQKVSDTKAG